MNHDHSGHSGHSGSSMPMPDMDMPMCSMNMLWNSQVQDVCVVFSTWHISGWMTMLVSCIAIILISIGYSSLLYQIKRMDLQLALTISQSSRGGPRRDAQLIPPNPQGYSTIENPSAAKIGVQRLSMQARTIRAALYALTVAISFFACLFPEHYHLRLTMAAADARGHDIQHISLFVDRRRSIHRTSAVRGRDGRGVSTPIVHGRPHLIGPTGRRSVLGGATAKGLACH
ncbi:solute carrier family 31 (copper transporter), member 1, partial [Tremellales sp. Uapishka_1]